jgi:hypothetical protein
VRITRSDEVGPVPEGQGFRHIASHPAASPPALATWKTRGGFGGPVPNAPVPRPPAAATGSLQVVHPRSRVALVSGRQGGGRAVRDGPGGAVAMPARRNGGGTRSGIAGRTLVRCRISGSRASALAGVEPAVIEAPILRDTASRQRRSISTTPTEDSWPPTSAPSERTQPFSFDLWVLAKQVCYDDSTVVNHREEDALWQRPATICHLERKPPPL